MKSSMRTDTMKSTFSAIEDEAHLASHINTYANNPKPKKHLEASMSDLDISEHAGNAQSELNIDAYMNKYTLAARE